MKGIKITAYKLIHLLNNRKGEAMYSFYKSIAKSQKIPFSNGLRVIVTLLLVGLLSSSTALGQTYPVQANLSITTPCPNRLSSLFPMGSSRVTLSLFLRDAMQQDVQAKLRFTIEGQGIKLETSPSYLPTPFHLQGGVPIVLRTELEPYFNPKNLMVTGASAGTFIQNRVLPEGVYTFTVEVIEARRQVVISNKAQTILLVMENEAPTLISPQPNSVAEPNPVQNLFISWISPIVITPSLGIPINYELSIWDAPQGTDPNLAIRSLRPKETVETTRTNFVWNTTNTELVVGNWYILAVKAIDPSGELSFKNNGLSQPVMFRYGTPCLPPINPTHSDITQKGAKIAWTPIGGASQFLVEIKPKADKNDTWSELNANKSTLEVTTMLPSKAYVYRVSSVCGFMQSAPTREAELTTLPMPEQRGECTGNLSIPPVDDQTPLNALTPGSIILASGFMVTVDEVTNTEGTKFSGTGRATFPLFGFTLRVEFKNIQVNNLLQLLSGKIVALKNDDVTFLNNQPNTNNNTFDYSNPQDTLIIPEVIDTVYQNDNGDWVVVSTDSTEVVVEPDPTGTLIIDSTGGGVVVGPSGYQPYNPGTGGNNPTGSNGDLPNKLASKRVTFTKGGYQHRNGFEPVNKNMPSNYYQSITIGDSTLLLPWKSVGTTGQDKLFATPVEDPAHTFAFQNGSAVSASAEGTSYGVWVTPPPAGEDNLLALAGADTSLAGAIRVKAYSPIRRVLKVVPVGGNKPMFSAASLQTELNRIYAQALTEWEVSFTQPLQSTNWDVAPLNFVELPETDYSTEMRAIWQAFLAEQTYDRNAVYLFVVTGFNKADTRGYMPLRSGYGFISTAATARDAAHELGHGVFNLRHTFSPYNRYQLPESTTSNLMDYKNGTDLLKYQWDYIHDPEGGLFLFEDSEEGAMEVEKVAKRDDYIKDENGYATFVSPAGMPITIKPTGKVDIIASTEEYNYQVSDDENTYISTGLSIGILLAFEEEGKHYTAAFGADKEFLGYKDIEGDQYKYDNITKTYRESYFVNFIDAQEKFYLFESKFILSENWKDNEYKAAGSVTYPFDPDVFKTIVGDLSAEDYTRLVDELAERLNTQSSQSKYFSVGESFKTGRDEELHIEDLNDRFKVFNTETGNKIFVDVVYTKDKPSSEQLSTLAEDAYKKSNLASSSNVIYMVLPVWNETVITNYLKTIDKGKFSKSYYSKNETYNNVSDLLEYKGTSGNIFEVVESVYTLVPKPHIIIPYAITYNGEIIRFKIQETDNVTGNSFIYDFRLAVDNLLSSFVQQVNIIESNQPKTPPSGYGTGYTTEYQNQAILRAMEAKEQIDDYRASGNNIEYKTIKHGLFESALTPNSEGVSEIAQQFTEWYLRHEFGWSASSPDDKYFKIGKNEVVYQETLNSIDKLGLLLMPVGLDVIADGIGAIYAGYYYDIETASYYVGGVVAVGVSGAIFRQLVTRGKRITRVSGEFRIIDNVVHLSDDLASYAGKITKEGKNLLELESPVGYFRQLKHVNGKTYRAANFWTDNSTDIIHYVSKDAKYYIKHDPVNGRLLFVDAETNKFMGFALDESNLIKGDYEELISNLKTIHGLPGGSKSVSINGTVIGLADDNANLILGKYNPNGTPGVSGEIGTDDIINELTILKNYSFADKTFELRNGSVHVLNIPDGMYKPATFFETYNKEILDLAVINPTKVRVTLVSDPRKSDLLTLYRNGVKTKEPTGFAQEIKYLREKGITIVYLKDGSQLNLNTIDLDILEWSTWKY